MSQPEFITLTDEQVKARKRRNIAIAFGLVLFIVTVYAITVSRMNANNQARLAQEAAQSAAVTTPEAAPAAAPADAVVAQ